MVTSQYEFNDLTVSLAHRSLACSGGRRACVADWRISRNDQLKSCFAVANFAAYTFAPPILVTPLGALSVLIGSVHRPEDSDLRLTSPLASAVLASFFLKEELGRVGRIGCTLCLIGSVIIVLHAPEDKEVQTVDEILEYAVQPGQCPSQKGLKRQISQAASTGFMFYCFCALVFCLVMIYRVAPKWGPREPIVYLSICSLAGSVSVMAIKGFGVAIKLTFAGNNQLTHFSTYVFAIVTAGCIMVQMNYFNKALDQFSTNV